MRSSASESARLNVVMGRVSLRTAETAPHFDTHVNFVYSSSLYTGLFQRESFKNLLMCELPFKIVLVRCVLVMIWSAFTHMSALFESL